MVISKEYIKNTVLIGLSFILLKSFNLVLPYFLDSESYNTFNKVFYYASLISTLGTFGFTYAITQINFTPIILVLLTVANIFVGFIFVNIFSGIEVSPINLLNIFLISFSSIIFSIYNFQLLFTSKTNKYFITIIIISIAHFLALFISVQFNSKILLLYGLFGLLGLVICFKYFDKGNVKDYKKIKNFYKLASATFIINSAAGIILMADKFFANNIFSIELSNAYTFSWVIIAPIFYLGNVAEKNIYAATGKQSLKSAIKNSLGLITLGLAAYFSAILLLVNVYSSFLPNTINIAIFSKIVLTMFGGYAVYIFLHFPLNGILFKFNLYNVQKYTAILYVGLFGILFALYYLNIIHIKNNDYLSLFSLVIIVLILFSVSKLLLVFYLQRKEVVDFFRNN